MISLKRYFIIIIMFYLFYSDANRQCPTDRSSNGFCIEHNFNRKCHLPLPTKAIYEKRSTST